ncbi:hypothetical protein AAH011_09670, partial [Parabacteroides distasonis]
SKRMKQMIWTSDDLLNEAAKEDYQNLLFCSLPCRRITAFIHSVHSPLTRRRPLIFPAKLRQA